MHRLPRQMPLKIALGYMLTGKHMSAEEGHRWGIVNEVVSLSELKTTVKRWTDEIQECAPLSVRATKQCAMMGSGLTLGDAFSKPYPALKKMMNSADVVEGPRAFAEKRKPNWQGR